MKLPSEFDMMLQKVMREAKETQSETPTVKKTGKARTKMHPPKRIGTQINIKA